jgi:hypothetical protein
VVTAAREARRVRGNFSKKVKRGERKNGLYVPRIMKERSRLSVGSKWSTARIIAGDSRASSERDGAEWKDALLYRWVS